MSKLGKMVIATALVVAWGTDIAAAVPPEDQQMLHDIQQAIVQYGTATGYYPPTLDDLYPYYMARLPRTASGQLFIYNNQNGYVAHPGTSRPGSYGVSHTESASGIYGIDSPGPDRLVLDHAGVLPHEHHAALQARARRLLDQQGVALIILVIQSPLQHGGSRGEGELERFARQVLGHWRNEAAEYGALPFDQSVLLVLSTGGREAWIELGSSGGNVSNSERDRFLRRYVQFHLQRERPVSALMTGTEALDRLIRGRRLPLRPRPSWQYNALIGMAVVAALSAVSFMIQGVGGYAWVFWGAVLSVLGYVLILYSYDYRIGIIMGTYPSEHFRNMQGGMGRGFGAYSVGSARRGW